MCDAAPIEGIQRRPKHEKEARNEAYGRRKRRFFTKSVKKTLPTQKVCVILRRSKSNSAYK
jgi:hypothetical protein